jgi:dTDP-4-amino-4,6-dideoxygalactose transaminase
VQLQRLDAMLARRRWLASRYSQRLAEIDWLTAPSESADCHHNFQSYMVRLEQAAPITRDGLMQELLDRGVSTRRGIMAIHRERPYRDWQWDRLLPQTNLVTDSTIVLPLFHAMTEDEQEYVIDCLKKLPVVATLRTAC